MPSEPGLPPQRMPFTDRCPLPSQVLTLAVLLALAVGHPHTACAEPPSSGYAYPVPIGYR